MTRFALFRVCIVAIGLGGCGTTIPLTEKELVAETTSVALTRTEHRVTVSQVKSNNVSAWHRGPIDTDVFRNALIETIRISGIFADIAAEPGGDLILNVEIISQRPVDPHSITIPLLVHYALRDARTGNTVWKKNIFSQPEIPFERTMSDSTGAIRHNTVLRTAIQDNFKQLQEALVVAIESL